jgi:hypothetical protein
MRLLDDSLRELLHEVKPWIVGRKSAAEDFAPIFKDDTPDEIKLKYKELVKLIKNERDDDDTDL